MPAGNENPRETSPLLESPASVHRTYEAVPQDHQADIGHEANGQVTDDEEESEREAQFKGLPEVQKQLKYIIPAIAVGIFLSAADQTIIVSSYGRIGSELHALESTQWIANGYFFTLAAFQPLYGKFSDIFGRKSCLLFAYVVFGLGCLFCGFARNMNELIAARVFAGIGGGGMTTVVSILLSDIVPLRERGVWQGYINIIYSSGAGIGAPLGGALADTIGWRWAFLIQAPMCAIAFLSVAFALHLPKKENAAWLAKLKRIDFLGALTLVAAVALLLLGFDRGSNNSWTAPITLVSLCVALPLFGIFALLESKIATEPFAPGRIIAGRSLFACYLCNFFGFGAWLAIIFYIPLFYQAVGKYFPSEFTFRLLIIYRWAQRNSGWNTVVTWDSCGRQRLFVGRDHHEEDWKVLLAHSWCIPDTRRSHNNDTRVQWSRHEQHVRYLCWICAWRLH